MALQYNNSITKGLKKVEDTWCHKMNVVLGIFYWFISDF